MRVGGEGGSVIGVIVWEDEKILLVVCEEGEIVVVVVVLGLLNFKN